MKKGVIIFWGCLSCSFKGHTQEVLSSANIQFEVKKNIHKTLGNSSWDDKVREWASKFSVKYFDFVFSDNKSIYKYNRTDEKAIVPEYLSKAGDEDVWYADYSAGASVNQHIILQNKYLIKDSLLKIKWFIGNEKRIIAGFNCRKATGIIFDSVYVFAFYTEDILVSGGPVGMNGLPGMILGLTIPRLHTSYMAVSVQVAGIDNRQIVPPSKGKAKNVDEIRKFISEKSQEWRYDKAYQDQFLWNALL